MSIYEYKANRLDGATEGLGAYKDKVLLVVNTASFCGFTPQFAGLEALYQDYASRGLEILGFPCNQFGHQDPKSNDEIGSFCQKNYGVTFPMFEKVEVNGADAHPLFKWLKAEKPGLAGTQAIKWNFTKFLVDQAGRVIKRYPPTTKPDQIRADIDALLETDAKQKKA